MLSQPAKAVYLYQMTHFCMSLKEVHSKGTADFFFGLYNFLIADFYFRRTLNICEQSLIVLYHCYLKTFLRQHCPVDIANYIFNLGSKLSREVRFPHFM